MLLNSKCSGLVEDGFKFIKEFKIMSVGMTGSKRMATFIVLHESAAALWFIEEFFLVVQVRIRL